MTKPTITSLSELHRGGRHLVLASIEVDIEDAPQLLDNLEAPGLDAQVEHIHAAAQDAIDRRELEEATVARAAAALAEQTAVHSTALTSTPAASSSSSSEPQK